MNVYDFLFFLWPYLSQYGVTSKVSSKMILALITTGLANIFFLDKGSSSKLLSWQVRREAFPTIALPLKIQTQFPILGIEGIYCAKMPEPDWFKKTPCDCKPNGCFCPQTVNCNTCTMTPCDKVPLDLVSPGKKLCPGEMQISWGRTNGGLWGQIVSVELPRDYSCGGCGRTCDAMFIEYYAGYEQIKCFDDIINLPMPLLSALAYFIASDVLMVSGTNREQQSVDAYNKGLELLNAFKGHDTSVNGVQRIDMNTQQYPGKNVHPGESERAFIPNITYIP